MATRRAATLLALAVLVCGGAPGGETLVPQDAGPELYTLTVERGRRVKIDRWWRPFLEEHRDSGYCFDLLTHPTHDRPEIGDRATILELGGAAQLVQLIELAPGAETRWHGYGWEGEALFVSVLGEGETEYRAWAGGMPPGRVTWGRWALLAVPPDHQVRHRNTGRDPARLLAVTGYGVNLYPHVPPEQRYLTENPREGSEERAATLAYSTYPGDRVADLRAHPVHPREARGSSTAFFNVFSSAGHRTHANVHLGELTRERAYAHRHGGQPMFLILRGAGYDLWSAAEDLEGFRAAIAEGRARRAPYREGTLCGVPAGPHWHQHFRSDATQPLRHLAINPRRHNADPDDWWSWWWR